MNNEQLGKFLYDFHLETLEKCKVILGPVMRDDVMFSMALAIYDTQLLFWLKDRLSQYFELDKDEVMEVVKNHVRAEKKP